MARASKSRSPRTITTAMARQIAAQIVSGESHCHCSVRALIAGLLVVDPKGENISPRRHPGSGSVAVFDPFAAIDSRTTPEID